MVIKSSFKMVLWAALLCAAMPAMLSCKEDEKKPEEIKKVIEEEVEEEVKVYDLALQLVYSDTSMLPYAGAPIELRNINGLEGIYQGATDSTGRCVLRVPVGLYEAVTSDVHEDSVYYYICNGINSQIVVEEVGAASFNIDVRVAKLNGRNPLIIKEIYNGGVMKDDGSGNFQFDKSLIIYNNGARPVSMANLCLGMLAAYNAEAITMNNMYSGGRLVFEDERFLPAQNGIWYFPDTLTVEPYSQVVVVVCGAIDNTQTCSNSVNYANRDYYVCYDPDYVTPDVTLPSAVSYNNTKYHPSPADVIPTSHYLKTVKYGQANAWPWSVVSPATILFQTKGMTPKEFAENTGNYWYIPGYAAGPVWRCVKVPYEWVLDGVEVWNAAKIASSQKRMPADIDAGYVPLTNQQGHVLYRNVDKAATEALPENAGKLVYGYALGVGASSDPSGIDAEASMRNGAHIVFQDTNNSTNDFHERQRCSLRGM